MMMIEKWGGFRFAAVISHPIQHYAPIFRDLAKIPGMDVKVFYCTKWGVESTYDPDFACSFAWDVPLLEGYEYEFLPIRREPERQSFWTIDNPRIGERLSEFAPHAMWIHGYGFRSCWRALSWARGRCASLYFGDSELLHHRSWLRRAAKSLVVRRFFRRCDAFITIGDNNEAYYQHYGVPREKLFRGACPVDVKRFQATVNAVDRPSRAELRRRYGLPADAVVAIFSAKMIPIKRPLDLVHAIGELRKKAVPAYALFLGDGPLRPAVEQEIAAQGLQDYVKLAGFVNQKEIPLILDCGDILAMTSEKDPHPLSVTESMCLGHAIVASDRIGCVGPTDSARPGVNAIVYPVGQVSALADAIQTLIEDVPLRERMSRASLDLVKDQDVPVAVAAVLRAIRALRPRFQPQWRDLPESTFTYLKSLSDSGNLSSAGSA